MTQPAPIAHSVQPYYLRKHQSFAVDAERQRHMQALYIVGEPALFTLLWQVEDFQAGLVEHCPRCYQDPLTVLGRVQVAYKQPLTARCLICFGTTFVDGFRAQIIRPAIFGDSDEDELAAARGVIHPEKATVESTHDFRSHTGDFVFRRDGTRWQLGNPSRVQLRTGYEHLTSTATQLGYSQMPASREDESSVAYIIPPDADDLDELLDSGDSLFPFTDPPWEEINGPLITGEGDDW